MLFATASASDILFFIVLGLVMIGVGLFRLHIYLHRPDIWEAEQRLKLEKARQQMEMRARGRNQLATGIAGVLLKAFFGHRH